MARKAQKSIDIIEKQIEKCSRQINYTINEYTIGYLADEMHKALSEKEDETGNFLIPDYQREFVWDDNRKSRFIESIIMGLPIPFIFYYENTETGQQEIVDGTQRLRTIHAFIHDGFTLKKLDRLTHLKGKKFSDLSDARKRKIRNRSIRGIVLNEHADAITRQDLFNRINTGSLVAESAEIRRGSLPGKFMDMIIELASDSVFTNLVPASKQKTKKREREELITRFFAFGDGLEDYKEVVEVFLFDFVKKMNVRFDENTKLLNEYKRRFGRVMQFVKKHFPLGFKRQENANSVQRGRFESIAVGTWLAMKETNADSGLNTTSIHQWINCDEYKIILRSDAANNKSNLNHRIDYVKDKLLESSQDVSQAELRRTKKRGQ